MRNLVLILLLFLSTGVAYSQTTYRENMVIGGGVTDADGGSELSSDGDVSLSGDIVGHQTNADYGTQVSIRPSEMNEGFIFTGNDTAAIAEFFISDAYTAYVGTETKPMAYGYFLNLAISQTLTLTAAIFSSDLTLQQSGLLGGDQSLLHRVETTTSWGNNLKTISEIKFEETGADGTVDKAEGNIEFYAATTTGFITATPQLSISGDDDITANVAINAEGGVYVGGTEVISPASADQILYANVNKPLTAKLDFSASVAKLVDADISDTLTIGSSSDLSSPPAIGGTTPAAAAFTITTTPEITSGSVMDLKSPSVSGSDAFRFGYEDTVSINDTKVSFYNNTTEQASIDLYDGDFLTIGDVTSDGANAQDAAYYTTQTEDLTIVDLDAAASRIYFSANGSDILQSFYGYAVMPLLSFLYANGTSALPTVVADADIVGQLTFSGYDGTDYETAAYMSATVDGTPGSNDMPGALNFYTTPNGSATPVLALEIDNAQGLNSFGVVTVEETSGYSFDASSTNTQTYINGYGNTNIVDIQRAQGTSNSKTIVANGNSIGVIRFNGYDGSAYQRAAYINVTVNGAPGSSDMPGKIAFGITPDGSASALVAMEIDEDAVWLSGDMEIGVNNTLTQTETTTYGQSTSTGIREYKRTAKDDGAGNPIVVTSGQFLDRLTFQGWDGANWRTAAEMIVVVDGTAGVADMPGEFRFYTTPDGTSSAALALTISNEGNVIVSSGEIISGSTTIVNTSNEVLVAAFEDSNSLTATDTWVSGVQTDEKGVILDYTKSEPIGTTIVSGASQTVPVTSKYMELSAVSSASISTFSGADFEGQELIVQNTVSTAIVLFDSIGNIDTLDDTDITLNANDWAKFFWDGDEWREINHKT